MSTFMWPLKLFKSVPPGFARNILLKKEFGGGEKKRKAGFRYGLDQALLSLSLIEATNLIYFHHQHRSPSCMISTYVDIILLTTVSSYQNVCFSPSCTISAITFLLLLVADCSPFILLRSMTLIEL